MSTTDIFSNIVLGRTENYNIDTDKVIVFKNTDDIVDGILCNYSNMAGGFPFTFAGHQWKSSEVLYLCGEFSADRDKKIQEDIRSATSGYAAKRFKKAKYKKEVREDFPEFRLQWMLYVVWQKCLGNAAFRKKLLEVPEDTMFVENTTTDNGGTAEIWGCRNKPVVEARKALKKQLEEAHSDLSEADLDKLINVETNKIQFGTWTGQNNIGKILKICQKAIIHNTVPPIDCDLLNSYDIYILGQRITFEV